jgi:hypothetical protein
MALENSVFSSILNAPATVNPSITVQTEAVTSVAATYRFKVSAVNIVGEGPLTDEIAVIAADLP